MTLYNQKHIHVVLTEISQDTLNRSITQCKNINKKVGRYKNVNGGHLLPWTKVH